ncbi:mannonate dehydratase [Natrialba taiwanensis]|uniref:mannonate dehydratase n=1 Tax=Natrialba taiwanensis TaxID=160846 RepID=UPI00373AE8BD
MKLGLHPDDSLTRDGRGMPRIINSPGAYECVLDIADSQYNGITFCHGNFSAMDVDVPATIRRFTDRINFVHFRDVAGTPDNFTETWHDDGPTDMAAAIEAYRDIGFDESGRLYDRYRSSSRLRWADRERLASVVEGSIGVDLVRARPQGAVR